MTQLSVTMDATIERLVDELPHSVSRQTIAMVVKGCLNDLAGTPHPYLPELSERAARQRLGGSLATQPIPR